MTDIQREDRIQGVVMSLVYTRRDSEVRADFKIQNPWSAPQIDGNIMNPRGTEGRFLANVLTGNSWGKGFGR